MSVDRGEAGVRSVQLALDVLEAVAFSTEELGVTQIADRVRVTKGSVHRHLLTLVDRGYLTQIQRPPAMRLVPRAVCSHALRPIPTWCRSPWGQCASCVTGWGIASFSRQRRREAL